MLQNDISMLVKRVQRTPYLQTQFTESQVKGAGPNPSINKERVNGTKANTGQHLLLDYM